MFTSSAALLSSDCTGVVSKESRFDETEIAQEMRETLKTGKGPEARREGSPRPPFGIVGVFPARMRKWAMDGVFTEPGGLTGGARRCNSRAASSGDCERLLWSAFATPRGN